MTIYRGFSATEEDLKLYEQVLNSKSKLTYLRGFCSFSKSRQQAMEFMQCEEDDKIMILMVMNIEGEYRWHFEMDGPAYSNFPKEQEVLLTDGYLCQIQKIDPTKKKDGKNYTEITFIKQKKY